MSARRRPSLEREQLELFRALPGVLAPRDAQDLMAYPFFSLAKSKRKEATGRTAQQEREGESHVGAKGKSESSPAMRRQKPTPGESRSRTASRRVAAPKRKATRKTGPRRKAS